MLSDLLYTAAARALGVRAVFAFPLRVGDTHVGTLELYRTEPVPMEWEAYYRALVYAEAALDLMVDKRPGGEGIELHPGVSRALEDRVEVYHAVGMVAVQAGVSLDNATSLLRGHAFANFQSLIEAAIDVVEGTVVLGPHRGAS